MNFEMSEDRRMLADTLTRFLTDKCPMETRNEAAYEAPFHSEEMWSALAGLGVLGALAPEEKGGFGGAGFDILAVFEPLGAALSPEPVLPALLAARLLGAADEDLDPLLGGETRYALAYGETDAPWALEDIATEARQAGEGWTVSGRKCVVYGGGVADKLLVAARGPQGLGLFEVAADAATIAPFGMIDGGNAAEIVFDAAPARLLIADATAALEDALNAGAVALCAEALGAMQAVFGMTVDYLKTRKQFGRAIGSFQALQHRAVEMAAEIEQARSITILAADKLDGPQASRFVSMAKNFVGRAARLIGEESVQMHGGIAMTWEYPASHYCKRLVMMDHQLGDEDFHLERVMAGYAA